MTLLELQANGRRISRQVNVGGVAIGGDAPVAVQSMLTAPTTDTAACLEQARPLVAAGCDILRVAVPNEEAARSLGALVKGLGTTPVVADIHFDHRLALIALDQGVAKLRINPGNIGSAEAVQRVAKAAAAAGVPVRVGVNSGSLPADLLAQSGGDRPTAMVASAVRQVEQLYDAGLEQMVVSLKSSSVRETVAANLRYAAKRDEPLHLGVTEAGTLCGGLVAGAAGIGALLLQGIGDTLRFSLTAPLIEEVNAGVRILRELGLRQGAKVVCCPTCARCRVDLAGMATRVEAAVATHPGPLTLAVMGCAVNGPGEARHADAGLAGGDGKFALFVKGEIIGTYAPDEALEKLLACI